MLYIMWVFTAEVSRMVRCACNWVYCVFFCKMVYFMYLQMIVTKDLPQIPFTVISPGCVLLCIWRWIKMWKVFLTLIYIHKVSLHCTIKVCFFIILKSTVVSKGLTTLTTFIGVLFTLWTFVQLKMTVFCKGLPKSLRS